jgi:iron complex transport system ATP-binding protein
MELVLKDLVIGYNTRTGQRRVTAPLSVKLPEGRLICLVGRNGVGKSTLLRSLSALQPPLSGDVLLDGRSIASYSHKALARLVSVVTTRDVPVPSMTSWEVVALGRSPYTQFWGQLSPADKEIVDRSIDITGISPLASRRVGSLSDGERQKVMIAKAIAQETPVILLDEPTAFLDYPSKVSTLSLLSRLAREMGRTILVSTHDVEHALRLSDEVLLLQKEGLYKVLRRDALVLDHSADGLGQQVGDGDLLDLGTALGVWDGVGEDNLLKRTVLHAL